MKRLYFISFLFLGFLGASAQNQPKGFHLEKPINMSAVLSKKPSVAMGFSSVSEARTIINDILNAVDIQQNFTVESTSQVDNAAAVIYQNTRYILYNPTFINQLDNTARDKWASISVVGHEIGHHLLGHTLDGRGSQIPKELEADEFSGLVLRRMGASLQQAQLAMKLIASPYASATHPGENDRLAAIAKGWNSTTAQTDRGNRDVAVNTPDRTNYPGTDPHTYPAPSDSRTYPAPADPTKRYPPGGNSGNFPTSDGTRERYPNSRRSGRNNDQGAPMGGRNGPGAETIVYDIRFNGSNNSQYFITSLNEVIMLRGNRALVVAKMAGTNRADLPYVIFDDRQQIYLDRNGNLFAENGRRVGHLMRHRNY